MFLTPLAEVIYSLINTFKLKNDVARKLLLQLAAGSDLE